MGTILGFIVWTILGFSFIGMGIYSIKAKKKVAFSFWANAEMFPVNDAAAYNRAVGKLWLVFGVVLLLLGIPLLKGQDSAALIVPILGTMAESIVAMGVYVTVIEKKYRKK